MMINNACASTSRWIVASGLGLMPNPKTSNDTTDLLSEAKFGSSFANFCKILDKLLLTVPSDKNN